MGEASEMQGNERLSSKSSKVIELTAQLEARREQANEAEDLHAQKEQELDEKEHQLEDLKRSTLKLKLNMRLCFSSCRICRENEIMETFTKRMLCKISLINSTLLCL